MRAAWWWSGVVLAMALAGCAADQDPFDPGEPAPPPGTQCPAPAVADQPPGDPSPAPLPVREGFEAVVPGPLPLGWSATDGTWSVESAPDAVEGRNVLQGQGDVDPGFSALLIGPAGTLEDVDLEVRFNMGCVEHPHGVGVVLHVAGPGDYQIIRYSATEQSWDFFTVVGGERTRIDAARLAATTDPVPFEWVTLRVESVDGRIRAFDGLVQVLEATLSGEDATAGQVGLFLRGPSEARFDQVRVGLTGLPFGTQA